MKLEKQENLISNERLQHDTELFFFIKLYLERPFFDV